MCKDPDRNHVTQDIIPTENKLKGGDQCIVIQLHLINLNQVVNPTIQLQILISSSESFNLI